MILIMLDEVVSNNWMSADYFYTFLGVAESTPGPIAINLATFIGSHQYGLLGSICSTLGIILPSFIIILLIAKFMKKFIDNKYVKGALKTMNAIIVAMICTLFIMMLKQHLFVNKSFNIEAIIIGTLLIGCMIGYKIIKKKNLSSISIILLSAILGILVCSI